MMVRWRSLRGGRLPSGRGDGGDFGRRLGQGVSKGSSACAVLRAAGHHNPVALRVEYKSEGVQTTSPFILTWLRSLVIM